MNALFCLVQGISGNWNGQRFRLNNWFLQLQRINVIGFLQINKYLYLYMSKKKQNGAKPKEVKNPNHKEDFLKVLSKAVETKKA